MGGEVDTYTEYTLSNNYTEYAPLNQSLNLLTYIFSYSYEF